MKIETHQIFNENVRRDCDRQLFFIDSYDGKPNNRI